MALREIRAGNKSGLPFEIIPQNRPNQARPGQVQYICDSGGPLESDISGRHQRGVCEYSSHSKYFVRAANGPTTRECEIWKYGTLCMKLCQFYIVSRAPSSF
jgi:hypothetical protein